MSDQHVIRDYIYRSIIPGHMGRATYFTGDRHSSGSHICACDEIPTEHAPKVGDKITVEYRYDLYGGPWSIAVNGTKVMQMTMERVEADKRATDEFIQRRMKELREGKPATEPPSPS